MPQVIDLDHAQDVRATPVAPCKPVMLVVDDDSGPRQTLRIVFGDDFKVVCAENGTQAIQAFQQHPVEVAILDINMPGMTGIELLDKLKSIDPDVQILMLTGYETVETAKQALRLGACDYISKPFNLNDLKASVASSLKRRAFAQTLRSSGKRLRELQEEIRCQRVETEIARTKGDIYASIIHDINGPLTVISGFIELINYRLVTSDVVENQPLAHVRDHIDHISRQVNNCIDISHRYLSYIRGRSTESNLVGINQVLQDLGDLLRVHPAARNHQLSFVRLREDAVVRINGTDLMQILLNLAINALQCSELPHRVEVQARVLDTPIDPKLFVDDHTNRLINREEFVSTAPQVVISVADDGPGIPAEVMPRMFESYFTTKSAGKGTGLGLSIVSRFVKEARGAIHLQSLKGQGTTFNIYLPARLQDGRVA